MRLFKSMALIFLFALLTGCGYNRIQQQDEAVKAQWSEVLNQYQRRADLVPNLVNTVKGYAAQEERVLIEVTNARARVGGINLSAEQAVDPTKLAEFQKAQSELSGTLSRLLVVSENYPQLKSDSAFRDLQAQLEGTENRIAVARNRYIQSVQDYNTLVRGFPVNLTARMFGYAIKPNFTVENEAVISRPPSVEFAPTSPPPTAPLPPVLPPPPPPPPMAEATPPPNGPTPPPPQR